MSSSASVEPVAIAVFLGFVALTLAITIRAGRQMRSTTQFYAAGNRITGLQNGLAIAGDFMSAATFLGIAGLIYTAGFDAAIYILCPLIGLAFILFLMAERVRNLGRFTFADVVSYRLAEVPVRAFAALGSLSVVILYMIAQLVGAGKLVQILFGLPYPYAVGLVGLMMVTYVGIGGMIATTWVQIIKAVLLIAGISLLAFLVLSRFGFDLDALLQEAVTRHPAGEAVLAPGGAIRDPLSGVSLAMALVFGMAGLPHILMRFFTVPNAREARRSIVYATGVISYVFLLIFYVVGYGGIALVMAEPSVMDASGTLPGGPNMVALHLTRVVGGSLLLGFMAAVAFATILAVVSGLTLAGASAISHDLYAKALRRGKTHEKQEMLVSRLASLGIGAMSVLLAIQFEHQNIAYMVGLAFAVAASANFPVLLLTLYWRGLTTRGAVIGGLTGLGFALSLVILGPTVWVDVLGHDRPVFPYKYPALFSMPIAFASIWLVSTLDRSRRAAAEAAAFDCQFVISQCGPRNPEGGNPASPSPSGR